MKDEEKNLIENLFERLKKTELNSSERDDAADELIQKLVKNQPASSYYMAQTILVQETHIKAMNLKIEELKKHIATLKEERSGKKPSFLSNFFKKNSTPETIPVNNNIWKNQENILPSYHSNATMSSPIIQTTPTAITRNNSGFLSNALQTATGVAGGMILGNMLMNVFNHSKLEEENFDTINKSSLDHHTDENLLNHTSDNHKNLIDYEKNESNFDSTNESNLNVLNDSSYEVYNTDHLEDSDINDDNFI